MNRRGTRKASRSWDELEAKLKALSSLNRLRLVAELRRPRTVDDIHLTPSNDDENADRPLTRQGVRHHLSRLEEADLVRSTTRSSDAGRDRREYVVNEPALFGLLEELRGLVAPGTNAPSDPFQTDAAKAEATTDWPDGPKLVLLQGADEEQIYDLGRIEPQAERGRGWVIGRSPESEIPLQYDPYLSAQNTEVLRRGDGFRLVDLRTSRNGTILNDERLPPGDEVPLSHGDVVRVGCSTLVFQGR